MVELIDDFNERPFTSVVELLKEGLNGVRGLLHPQVELLEVQGQELLNFVFSNFHSFYWEDFGSLAGRNILESLHVHVLGGLGLLLRLKDLRIVDVLLLVLQNIFIDVLL